MSDAGKSVGVRANRPGVNAWNAEYLEAQFEQFRKDPASIPDDLRSFFQGFELGRAGAGSATGQDGGAGRGVESLLAAYREAGHLGATIDPFGRTRARPARLSLGAHGLTDADLGRPAPGGTLRDTIASLERAYCSSIGVEFAHITEDAERRWFQERFEGNAWDPSPAQRREILAQLTAIEKFEYFLGKRFQGKKRFSLEGGESLIPFLKGITARAGELGTREIILGMAHRGRVAVLRHYLGKDLQKLFTEFKDSWIEDGNRGGDVKYHRGYSGEQALGDGSSVHLSMLNNPSHLESVNGVVMGKCRAKQDLTGDTERRRVVSLLIHGDAAISGQGVVAECLNMAKLEGYDVGGTLHVVINNLVGFTTDPEDSRSTDYCTDIAKMIGAPVLHVNGDDPEAVVRAARLAAEYRHEFRKDVFVDIVCFRRYGHNEQDEPAYTQPQLYALVRQHPGTPQTYRRSLIDAGVISVADAEAMGQAELDELDKAYEQAAARPVDPVPPPGLGQWQGITGEYTFDSPATAVDAKVIAEACAAMGRAPAGFNVHPKLRALLDGRAKLPQHGRVAHADAEMLAFATLLLEGTSVRLAGQDSRRGTFTQRHAVLRDEQTGERYVPINHVRPNQPGRLEVWDSPLSEFSVMGFEYGYSRANPRCLVLWEAQFGDFCNGAQVLIDQYLAASESKWNRWAGLVLLLPHGYEGQGPEHSSARVERFLQLGAERNMEIAYPSTGAQMFHLLRRQAKRNFRKPLVVLTPKKHLRIETSTMAELSTGAFRHAIDDTVEPKGVSSVVYCSGKIYHELAERRQAIGRKDVAIVRLEQLYPFHAELVRGIDARYPRGARRVYCQEEPRNAGAYLYVADRFREELRAELSYIGRAASATPATASERVHALQQEAILAEAVGPLSSKPGAGPANGAPGVIPEPRPARAGTTQPGSPLPTKAKR